MSERTVKCVKLGQELPGLPTLPFQGPLGQRIFESVSKQAWDRWQDRSFELVQQRRLSMADPEHRKVLLKEMERFLFEDPEDPELPPEAPLPEGSVRCAKLGKILPRMKAPPFPGPLGQRIFENVSQKGWDLWDPQAVILMNHYGLSLADPEARRFLMQQMEEFFFGEGAQLPGDWTPPTAGGKGAPGPRRK
jgi:Fe-S cluster biosynthesis and repair protein YggX